tara:strand:+ start:641 stop:883 length:243 start_codon:yes stop_codon:yes gene_type:complete
MVDSLSLPSGYYEKTSNDEVCWAQVSVSAQSAPAGYFVQGNEKVVETRRRCSMDTTQVITLVGASAPAFSTETKLQNITN